jgi:hypothetical protein
MAMAMSQIELSECGFRVFVSLTQLQIGIYTMPLYLHAYSKMHNAIYIYIYMTHINCPTAAPTPTPTLPTPNLILWL